MKVILDLDSHSAIQDFANRSPAGAYQFKSQDTVEWEVYFVSNGVVQDLGAGFAMKFGMIKTGDLTNTILAYQTTFTHLTDSDGNVYYSGLVNFNTSQMATAIGTSPSIQGTAEIRYQDSLSEIIHSINIATVVYATILVETGVTPPGVSTGYPDASTIELLVHKNAASGYAGLDSSSLVLGSQIPVDNKTIAVSGGKIASSAILATTAANFTTPAASATVSVTFSSTSNLKASSYVRIPIAGYYIVSSITDSTHAVLTNNGDPFNAASGVTITSGTVVLPAQAAAGGGGGSPGQNAYTTTLASFVVPAGGSTVSVNLGSTTWLAGSGQVLFIQGAGYYAVASIPDSTHAVLTNLGYASTNAVTGTTIPSGAGVSPGGLQGPASTASGANAYDTTQAGFTMPAAAASVNVTITNTNWLGVGQEIYIAGAGYFSVASITSPTIFSATNSNYPGAASPGSTVSSGAKVSPGGLIGPQGAGGAGLNAYSTLTSSFTQPASAATVAIVVGSTAWITAGMNIYVAGGGFYTVSVVTDLTHVTVINQGVTGNTAPGSTVTGSGTQLVSPSGAPGTSGSSAYTTTAGSFVMPNSGSSVTIPVITTAFMANGQNIFVQNAGYFTVATVVDATHVSATNNGASGNVAAGATIPTGSSVVSSGANGATGSAGAPGPAGRDGAYSTIYTQYSLSGTGGSGSPAQLVNDAAQGTNAYAHYQRDASGNNLWGPIPTDGTTITVTAGKLTVISSGGGGPFDPRGGVYYCDDFIANSTPVTSIWGTATSNGIISTSSNYGYDSTRRTNGLIELTTGTLTTGANGSAIILGNNSGGTSGGQGVLLGFGTLDLAARIAIEESSLPVTGNNYIIRFGLIIQTPTFASSFPAGSAAGTSCVALEYSPDNNAGNLRIGYIFNSTSGLTYTNCSAGPVANTYGWWELKITSGGVCTAYFNGTSIGSVTISSSLLGIILCPYIILYRFGSATNYHVAIDTFFLNYPYTR